MSSWSYPTRSRSRSPTRARAGYPDQPQDPYRPDYDAYDRDRGWGYERGYDYGRRGRSRSPPPDEAGRKRRRSMSPYDRDRYDPRPRYSDDYDAHSRGGYYSPRRNSQFPPPPSRRAPPDPHTFDYPASLKQYAEWFRFYYPQQATEEDNADKAAEHEAGDGSKPRNGIKSKWEKYKRDFAAGQLQTMFDHHRKSPWFAEKYDPSPEFVELRTRIRHEGWAGRLESFRLDLEEGKYDPNLNETLPEADKTEKDAINGTTNGEKNEAADANGAQHGTDEVKDEDMPFNDAGDDDERKGASGQGGAGAGADKRGVTRGEEISVMPEGNQVMIRTIPPDIGRLKLEEACSKIPGFVYIALGDPLQKRNFYRAGWLRFREDADMPSVLSELADKKIEGFKLHVMHNQRAFVNRIRYAPEVASRPDRMAKDLATAKTLAGVLEAQAAQLRKWKPKPAEGAEDAGTTDGLNDMDEETNAEDEQVESGSEAVERRVEKVIQDMREMGLVDETDERAFEEKKTEVALDLYLAYLRAAFNTCYYCAVVSDHLEELQRKCLKHERKPLSKLMLEEVRAEAEKAEREKGGDEMEDVDGAEKEKKDAEKEKDSKGGRGDFKRNDERWLEWLDSKLALLIDRDGVDPRVYSGKSYDDELTKAVEPFLKQEDEGKFRCKTCQKLFKATSFVEKHIANKHPELVKHLEDIPYFNNFALDPHHIQPFSHPPASVGNASQQPPPQAYGIQQPPAYGGDYGRPGAGPGPYYGGGGYPPNYPPPYPNNGYWEGQHPGWGPGGYPPMRPPPMARRDDRRLSDRISGFAPGMGMDGGSMIPAGAGLPPKPTAAALDSALSSGGGDRAGGGHGGRRRNGGGAGGPLPPPPPDAKEDPRAAAGKRVSYHDMDLVAEGDVELNY
ncbi:hypothetical protein H0H81_006413 [Sphagnurus paluster]|uniref:C2H2-type domain-containing protein n=1 Tax=Sphagnurus paluster TaxID=117069 RepID=A0A9P7FXX6_9AGAR|nr:hypothetical protein H0H81_006413 [Sphagnurus paluster]